MWNGLWTVGEDNNTSSGGEGRGKKLSRMRPKIREDGGGERESSATTDHVIDQESGEGRKMRSKSSTQ